MENKIKANIDGYVISSEIRKIIKEEGYVALRLINLPAEDSLKMCETAKISIGENMPMGADTIIEGKDVTKYERIILIEKDF